MAKLREEIERVRFLGKNNFGETGMDLLKFSTHVGFRFFILFYFLIK